MLHVVFCPLPIPYLFTLFCAAVAAVAAALACAVCAAAVARRGVEILPALGAHELAAPASPDVLMSDGEAAAVLEHILQEHDAAAVHHAGAVLEAVEDSMEYPGGGPLEDKFDSERDSDEQRVASAVRALEEVSSAPYLDRKDGFECYVSSMALEGCSPCADRGA